MLILTIGKTLGEQQLVGESSAQGAIRELFEETGISISESELHLLGTLKEDDCFADTYIIRKDVDISELTLQEKETVDARWVTLSQLDIMIANNELALPMIERLIPIRKKFEDFIFNK